MKKGLHMLAGVNLSLSPAFSLCLLGYFGGNQIDDSLRLVSAIPRPKHWLANRLFFVEESALFVNVYKEM
jgi:hypothetical protein